MTTQKFVLRAASLLVLIFACPLLTHAVTRTWVSGVGSDLNPCSRTAPCRTFSAAHAVTDVNGEISVLDHGSYGTVTITKSITIDGTGNFAGITASAVSAGITVNITSASDTKKTVRLRGISINGTGGSAGPNTGQRGIRILSALAVHVEDCVLEAFSLHGIEVNVATAIVTELHVRNTVIRNCVSHGIRLANTVAGGLVLATVDASQLSNNGTGLETADRSRTTLRNCTISTNSSTGVGSGGTSDVETNIDNCTLSYNGTAVGVGFGTVRVAKSIITGNSTGLHNFGGTIETYQNNQLRGNTNNTIGVITPVFPS